MTGFESSRDSESARERRLARLAEARRRVETGEVSAPPPAEPRSAEPRGDADTSRTSGRGKNVSRDPGNLSGERFALWRSSQHFCVTDSRPDAESRSVRALLEWSPFLLAFQLRRRIVARQGADGTWTPVSYVKDGSVQPITTAQADKYRDVRLGNRSTAQEATRELDETDHSESTEIV